MAQILKQNSLYFAWLNVTIATFGSLFFSEVLKYPPCNLCWYQRICMFPLVVILAIGIAKNGKETLLYSFPFAFLGWIISIYHNLLYYRIITTAIVPCSSGSSCTEKQIEIFGFLTIPLMSLIAFSIALIFLLLFKNSQKVQS